MDSTIAISTGVAVAIGVTISTMLQRKRNNAIAPQIEGILRERGPLTLPALGEAMGMGGFYARGKVVLALGQMQNESKVEVIPAPEGTPQLKKVDFIQYKLRG